MSDTAPEQPATGQDPQVTPEPPAPAAVAPATPPPAAPPAAAGSAPWANDLNAIFTDESTRGQVDQFLREKVQPYTTKLEQQTAQSQDAVRLLNDLNTNPIDTYVALTEEMFGAEAAQNLLGQLQAQLEAAQNADPAAQQQQGTAPPLDPRLENVIQFVENQQTSSYYDGEIAKIAADPQYTDVDTNLLHPFVAAADGNFEQAITLYREIAAGFQSGTTPPEVVPDAPAVLGSDSATPPSVPTERKNPTLDDAINDFMNESRANREAPPVA